MDEYVPDLEAAVEGEDLEWEELEEESGEELPALVKEMPVEEKLEAIRARMKLYEHQHQLHSGTLNLFEDLYDILG